MVGVVSAESSSIRLEGNANRFDGFADLYDAVRPTPPSGLGELLRGYSNSQGQVTVVDLGCGTGLSARWCATWASRVIGVEPSRDMVEEARRHPTADVDFVPGWAHETGLPSSSADVVVVVQALHWMDPASTFEEAVRILRPGGVFAAIDCDWPPIVGSARAEREWLRSRELCKQGERLVKSGEVGAALSDSLKAIDDSMLGLVADSHIDRETLPAVHVWPKEHHLERMQSSGRFQWCREIAMHSMERGDADRFVNLLRSQGDFQSLRRNGATEEALGVERLASVAADELGPSTERPLWFTYRVRVGVT
jgi:SAM-dependent methyltransferase